MRRRTIDQGDTRAPGQARALVDQVIERVHPRRRASDFADQRANRAAKHGDLIALWVASGQAEAARRRREEWLASKERVREPEQARSDD